MDLATVVDVSQIVAALTVVGGTLFAVLQLREIKQQRQEAAALDLLRAFMGPEFAEAMAIVTSLPDGLTVDGLRRAGPDAEKAATLMCTTFEAMGVLVHRRIAPLSLVQDIAGGIILVTWRRLEPWLTELRIEQGNPSDSEWFQWLAEQLERRKTEKQPAYLLHREWQP
ncbi:MAG TPA: hypothetical protein PL152_11595 [Steroidobacteraceae bacterium]|nr:hypothetical protein [Steroidobacteraceae bacterium]